LTVDTLAQCGPTRRQLDRAIGSPSRAKFPGGQDAINCLSGTAWQIMHELAWLTRCARRDRPGKAAYVQPSQGYLARKCAVSREHVNRLICGTLAPMGLVIKTWRRPKYGAYQTCLYFVTPLCKWLIGRVISRLSSQRPKPRRPSSRKDSVMYTAHKPTSFSKTSGLEDAFSVFRPPRP
jgi:hypothetical protein